MVLRSGIIIPFQFRDCKKLLMIGVPEENRDLSIWDLKNVVRAAFGIYNFEFRNKKIGFIIPDELLLHYLAQRHDLTNFVIEIGQANDSVDIKEHLSFEPSCSSQKIHVPLPQRSNDSGSEVPHLQAVNYTNANQNTRSPPTVVVATNHSSDHSTSNQEPPHKLRISQAYSDQTPETMTQSIDPLDIIPKSEQDEMEMEMPPHSQQNETRYNANQQALQQQQQIQQHQQSSQFFGNYAHGLSPVGGLQQAQSQPQQPCTPPLLHRFRRRGERMSKDQKEVYVEYFEENPCMLTQRRNDIMLEPHWNKLANMLNAVPQGAVKNVEEWKQTFDAWRYRVFMYTRYNSKLSGAAAQNPKNYKPLTHTDQRAYAMWTSHKNTMPQDYDKMDMFAHLEETQADYDY